MVSISLPLGPGVGTNRGALDEKPTKGSSVFVTGWTPNRARPPSRRRKKTTTDTNGTVSQSVSGKDKFEIPASFTLGANIRPVDNVTVAFDYQLNKFSQGEFKLAV